MSQKSGNESRRNPAGPNPPEKGWEMVKERITRDDGRYLIFYRFTEPKENDLNAENSKRTS